MLSGVGRDDGEDGKKSIKERGRRKTQKEKERKKSNDKKLSVSAIL